MANTAELEEGRYTGLVYVDSGDDCCPYTCIEIALDVSGDVDPVLKRSWGQIKWDSKRAADEKKPD